MMALNIAVPLASTANSVADLMDGFGLLSPISPLSVDCREVLAAAAAVAAAGGGTAGINTTAKKQLVSPVGSESSGVSSLDSDEMKKPTPPTTPTEEVDRPAASSPLPEADESGASSASTRSSLSSESDSGSSEPESSEVVEEPEPPKECKLVLGGRDVLNLMDNLTAPNHFRLQFAQLPENDNIHFFLDNRSQYHRLGANGHIQEYTMVGCNRCDFRYPVNGTSLTSGGPTATMGQSSLAAAFPQQQQQQQQQQLQWNNLNSIANSRDKMGLNAGANAFTSTSSKFGGGNQYFRNGGGGGNAMALFGRDSNRGAANFLTANSNSSSTSTGTYNNHKTYQQQQQQLQSFGNKFNSYQQQQQFFSKNQPLRYGQSSGSGFNAMAAALAANQNLVNFNSFSGKNSSQSSAASNNNNMFAYYKTMM